MSKADTFMPIMFVAVATIWKMYQISGLELAHGVHNMRVIVLFCAKHIQIKIFLFYFRINDAIESKELFIV